MPQAEVVFHQEIAQIAGAGIDVLGGIVRIDTEILGGGRHQLHKTDRALGRDGMRLESRLGLDYAADQLAGKTVFIGGGIGQFPEARSRSDGRWRRYREGGRGGGCRDNSVGFEGRDLGGIQLDVTRSVIKADLGAIGLVPVGVQTRAARENGVLSRHRLAGREQTK